MHLGSSSRLGSRIIARLRGLGFVGHGFHFGLQPAYAVSVHGGEGGVVLRRTFMFEGGHACFFQAVLNAAHVDDSRVHEALEHGHSPKQANRRYGNTVLPMMTRWRQMEVRRDLFLSRDRDGT